MALGRQNLLAEPRQFGANRRVPGNLRLPGRTRTSNQAVMSAARFPKDPVFVGLSALFQCASFAFVHAVFQSWVSWTLASLLGCVAVSLERCGGLIRDAARRGHGGRRDAADLVLGITSASTFDDTNETQRFGLADRPRHELRCMPHSTKALVETGSRPLSLPSWWPNSKPLCSTRWCTRYHLMGRAA